jgi:hypothetical protein
MYRFCSEILRRCKSSNGIERHFLENNAEWLNTDFVLLPEVLANVSENLPSAPFVGGHRYRSNKVAKELKEEKPNKCVKSTKLKP